jgi:hypothetical protein
MKNISLSKSQISFDEAKLSKTSTQISSSNCSEDNNSNGKNQNPKTNSPRKNHLDSPIRSSKISNKIVSSFVQKDYEFTNFNVSFKLFYKHTIYFCFFLIYNE